MGSKIFLVLGLLVATALVITMEVAARDLAETSTNRKLNAEEATVTNGIRDTKHGGYGDAGTGPSGAHVRHPAVSPPYYPGYGDPATSARGLRKRFRPHPPPPPRFHAPLVGKIFCRYGCCGGIYPRYCTCCPKPPRHN